MSPRRQLIRGARQASGPAVPARWRGLLFVMMLSAAVAAASIALCGVDLKSHEALRQTMIKNAAALSYVRSFMTEFTSPDPDYTRGYAARILAQATGDFAEQYRHNQNTILRQLAEIEPTTGTVLDAGVARQDDNGGIEVLVTTKLASKSPDGRLQGERINCWVVTVKQEGARWKISNVNPMI
jgi:Mce-associated membrane protein